MPDSQLKKPLHKAGANQAVFVDRPTKQASVAFFKVVWMQGCGPDASGGSKIALGPVGIPLKGAPQAPGNKPNLSHEG